MIEEKMDIAKVMAILAQPKEPPAPLTGVKRLCLDIDYITKAKRIERRPVKVILPKDAILPVPLIYVPHYEMGEDALELRDYLKKGWAVASPAEFSDRYNGTLTDDDLVFNNAALYILRRRKEFDTNRICLVGGSAGAYMTMMLNGLQLGLCASVANGPIINVYFNFEYYWNRANALNQQALMRLLAEKTEKKKDSPEEEARRGETSESKKEASLAVMKTLMDVPIPFMAALAKLFEPIRDNFPKKEDVKRWEALSPIGLTECFSSPIMINHNTSDVLVPVDQITRKFTYDKPGASLPKDFTFRLPETFPGRLKYALDECLPVADTRTERFFVPENAPEEVLPYDCDKRFNINIWDDGTIEGYGTHSSRMDTGRRFDVPYLEEMFEKTAARTCQLTPGMLKNLLLRWQGKSIALPAHIGVDDTIYGSLAVYRKEVEGELSDWSKNHGREALFDVFEKLMEMDESSEDRYQLKTAMEQIAEKW